VVASWKHVPILLTFEHSIESGTTANIKSVILVALIMYGGLTNEEIVEWVVCLGLDGVYMFQGVRIGIIVLMKT
jgi:hypothetical protein